MATVLEIRLESITPTPSAVLSGQAIPESRLQDARTAALADAAIDTFRQLARPVGVRVEVSIDEFASIYTGEGRNAAETPLEGIYPSAKSLALFAVTVGEPVSLEIMRLFDRHDFAAGAMLDAAASVAADLAAETAQRDYYNELVKEKVAGDSTSALRFSPGYCGWHVSGQRKLFARLRPEQIGITLTDSCLMQPLKSVSGVLVAAAVDLFDIDDTYPFCVDCDDHSCRDRYQGLTKENVSN